MADMKDMDQEILETTIRSMEMFSSALIGGIVGTLMANNVGVEWIFLLGFIFSLGLVWTVKTLETNKDDVENKDIIEELEKFEENNKIMRERIVDIENRVCEDQPSPVVNERCESRSSEKASGEE